MTEELKQAAQAALEQLEFLNACYPHKTAADAADALRRALTQRPAAQTEREAFEAEMRCEETWGHRPLKKHVDGRYQNWMVDAMWCVWQARASLPAPQQATTEPTKAELIAQARDLIEAQEHAHEVGYRMGFAAATERKGEPVYMTASAVIDGKPYNWREVSKALYDSHDDRCRRVLYTSPQVPEGFALVPVEPTDKMVQATLHIDLSYMPGQEAADRVAIYRAMLGAARKGE